MSASLPEQGRPWPLYLAIGLAVLLVALALFFAGSPGTQTTDDSAANLPGETSDSACDRSLSEMLTAVDPLTLGISSSASDRAHDFNQWLGDCGRPPDGRPITEDRELIGRLLEATAAERVAAERFTQRDVGHIRTSLLLRQLAEHAAPRSESVTAQAVALFGFIDRNVLDPLPGTPVLPMTLYEVLCYGRGTPAQRAWLFAELLRQIRVDAVLIQPATGDAAAATAGPLVGVVVTEGGTTDVFVFDSRIGLPIPGPDEATAKTPFVVQPATLKQLQENDELLRRLDREGEPYPLTSEQLKTVKVGLIGSSSLWSERMALIDFHTSHRDAVLYDGLGPNRMQKDSLFDRVAAAGNASGQWTDEAMFVWPLPEEQITGFETGDVQQQPYIGLLNGILQGPYLDMQPAGTGAQLDWQHNLRDSRNLQISGDFKSANAKYRSIRGAQIIGAYQYRPENDAVQDFTAYWTATCQYERGEDESVRNSVASYPPRFFSNWSPFWIDGMVRLAAFSSARMGRWPEALMAIQQPNIPQTHGTGYLLRRWQRLAGAVAAPAAGDASPPPAAAAPVPSASPPAPNASGASPPAAAPAPMPAAEKAAEEKPAEAKPAEEKASDPPKPTDATETPGV